MFQGLIVVSGPGGGRIDSDLSSASVFGLRTTPCPRPRENRDWRANGVDYHFVRERFEAGITRDRFWNSPHFWKVPLRHRSGEGRIGCEGGSYPRH